MSVRNILMAAAGAQSGAYRYWRILVFSNNGDANYVAISEVELRATIGGADVTTPATTVTSSGSYDTTTQPNLAVDNINPSRGWISDASSAFPRWLQFDLGSVVEIKSVSISAATFSGSTWAPKDFSIQGSNDGANFTTVKSFSSTGWAKSETRVFNL